MVWKQVTPGHFERPLEATDEFMLTVGSLAASHNREHWCINITARLDLEANDTGIVIERLQKAWIRMRYDHPFIAAQPSASRDKFLYQCPDTEALNRWIEDTVFTETSTLDRFREMAQKKSECTLHYFPATFQLLLRLHHWLVDGVGSLYLMNKLLKYFAADTSTPTFGDEWKNLAPGFNDVVGLPHEPLPADEAAGVKMLMDFAGKTLAIGLPCERPDRPAETKRVLKVGDEIMQKAVVAACKARGFSVTSAVHAAIVVATQEMKAPVEGARTYKSAIARNYRPYLPDPYHNVEAWPMNNFFLALPIALQEGSFGQQANDLSRAYRLTLDSAGIVGAYNQFVSKILQNFGKPPPSGLVPTCGPVLSSVGVIDRVVKPEHGGSQKVRARYVELSIDVMDSSIVMYQWSWLGKFYISANFNTAYAKEGMVEKFVDRVYDILLGGLDIEIRD